VDILPGFKIYRERQHKLALITYFLYGCHDAAFWLVLISKVTLYPVSVWAEAYLTRFCPLGSPEFAVPVTPESMTKHQMTRFDTAVFRQASLSC